MIPEGERTEYAKETIAKARDDKKENGKKGIAFEFQKWAGDQNCMYLLYLKLILN